jgi:hypothetical protein
MTDTDGEVRRTDDGELLGYVRPRGDGRSWVALAVFGGTLGERSSRAEATALVQSDGLASLARRWFYRAGGSDEWEVVVIQEAWPGRAVGVFGLYALPGAPSFDITAEDLAAGAEMTFEPPDEDLAQFASR